MSLKSVVCVYTDVLSDGTSTSYSVDLVTGPVSFQAGINSGFSGFSDSRSFSKTFDVTNTPPSSAISAADQAGSSSSIAATVSGTTLTLVFSPANPNGYVARVVSELVF